MEGAFVLSIPAPPKLIVTGEAIIDTLPTLADAKLGPVGSAADVYDADMFNEIVNEEPDTAVKWVPDDTPEALTESDNPSLAFVP